MNRHIHIIAAALLALPGIAAAGDGPAVIGATYQCDRAVTLPVTFINPGDAPGLAVMMVEGKLVALRQATSGSGVRYVALDEQDSYRLYTKGSDAFVTHMAADHTAEEATILDGCHTETGF
ncbi:MliC family protein [Pukyongiella litopenaei]|uniref:Formate transporter n=1 Tax=Pukyongiella litopenaei TaxID=2605946 RepID=A0A2S0MSL9_9RHOB|nr:MliC family protein [Pukyongiella litopenaei]AVO38885.1 formate transporter [Pukyongiella litopenaei]